MKPNYDLIVIGSGPAGEKAAAMAAYYGRSVALVEKEKRLGGAGTNTGTLPSKTLKETAVFLSGINDRGLFGIERRPEHNISVSDLLFRKNTVTSLQADVILKNLTTLEVEIFKGHGAFVDAHTIKVEPTEGQPFQIKGDNILIATGSSPYHIPGVPFDGEHVHDSDSILEIDCIPKSIVIVGAGVIGCEYASVFAALGAKVTLINGHAEFLTFIDGEVLAILRREMEREGIVFLMPNRAEGVSITQKEGAKVVTAHLDDGSAIEAEMFLYAAGRVGGTAGLNLEGVGVTPNKRQLIEVDAQFRTNVPNIYAAGDVIGFPALASTSMDQGRVAVTHMFNLTGLERVDQNFPMGVYTIPEVTCVGMTEEEAKQKKQAYLAGHAWYRDVPRGRIIGSKFGLLKILVDPATMAIIGVHIIGRSATELVHFGLLLVEEKITVGRVASMVYNQPTLHELYKYAAFDVMRQTQGLPAIYQTPLA